MASSIYLGHKSESKAQLPPGSQTFGLLSCDELRQMHSVFGPHAKLVKHSSYEQPPRPTSPSSGKQRPFGPALQSESDVQPPASGASVEAYPAE